MITVADIQLGKGAPQGMEDVHKQGDLILIDGGTMEVSSLDHATAQGYPALYLRHNLPDGRVVLIECSARLYMTVAAALRGRYGGQIG